jgi:hypothetical protein
MKQLEVKDGELILPDDFSWRHPRTVGCGL